MLPVRNGSIQIFPFPNDGLLTIPAGTPETGFTAWFAEAEFNVGSVHPFKLTSGVVVRPDVYPHPPYEAIPPKSVTASDHSDL